MGLHKCQYGYVHKRCRCTEQKTVVCDVPDAHRPGPIPEHLCLVMEMMLDGRVEMPKHYGRHLPHIWYYTSWGGGHQMDHYDPISDRREKNVKKWRCPGWRADVSTN